MNKLRDSGIYEKLVRDSGSRPPLPDPIRETVKTILLEHDPPYHKKMVVSLCTLHPPPLKDGVLVVKPPFYQAVNLRKRFKLPWIISLAMQASCDENINDSLQI